MLKRALRAIVPFGALLIALLLLAAFQPGQFAQQTTVLYDGNLGSTPDMQGFSFLTLSESALQTYTIGAATLDTMAVRSDHAGYFAKDQPTLDRQSGYSVQFTTQIVKENHTSPHRAGFSIIVLSSDLQGIELGFWSNEIWAQEGGTDALFTHAEGVNFDTTAALTDYELSITTDSYKLSAGGSEILTGMLRDYTALEGILDPYETPNLLFLGDNSSRGQTKVDIAYVALQTMSPSTSTPSPTATLETMPTQELTSTPTATTTANSTAPATPPPPPTHTWYWWFPFTAGYPQQ